MKSEPSCVATFSYKRSKDNSTLERLDNIARRESKSRSEVILEAIREHVTAHELGNKQFSIETSSQPGFLALPTIGEALTPKFTNMPDDEFTLIGKSLKARIQEHQYEYERRNLRQMMREVGKIQ